MSVEIRVAASTCLQEVERPPPGVGTGGGNSPANLFTELQASGELVDAEQLAGTETAKTVRASGNGAVASDGPYVELKEYLGGYYIVDVDSFDRAAEIAGRFPEAERGLVDVLPVLARMGMGDDA